MSSLEEMRASLLGDDFRMPSGISNPPDDGPLYTDNKVQRVVAFLAGRFNGETHLAKIQDDLRLQVMDVTVDGRLTTMYIEQQAQGVVLDGIALRVNSMEAAITDVYDYTNHYLKTHETP